MQLKNLKLYNWCQFKTQDIQFSSGLTAIRGPNGSGKTNSINGIVFALTGDYRRSPGKKDANIYQLADSKDKSGVVLNFSHDGADVHVERWLRPNKRILTIAGDDKELTKEDDINNKICDILGVKERLLLDYVFVEQWKIFDFIDQDPSVRIKAFAELFDAEKADKIYKAIGDCKFDIPSLAVDVDRIKARIQSTKAELSQIDTALTQFAWLPDPWIESQSSAYSLIKAHEACLAAEKERAEIQQEIAIENDKRTALIDKRDELNKLSRHLSNELATYKSNAEAANKLLSDWTAFEAVSNSKDALETRKKMLEAELAAAVEREEPADYCGPDYAILEHELATMRSDMVSYQNFINTFDIASGLAYCPKCGTPTSTLKDKLEEYKNSLDSMTKKHQKLADRIIESKRWDNFNRNYQQRVKHIKAALADIETQLNHIDDVKCPAIPKSELQQLLTKYAEQMKESAELRAQINNLDNKIARLDGSIISMANRVTQLTAVIDATVRPDVDGLKVYLAHANAQNMERERLRIKKTHLQNLLQDDEAMLVTAEKTGRVAVKLRHASDHLTNVRDIFKDLPKTASQACLDSMRVEIDDMLERFDAPFRIADISDLKFTLRKTNGIITPADRLSGGQRVLFSLAFRVVVNSKFARQLGLLCLDEPTAGLDEDNLRCVEVALGRLRELSQSRGLQVIIITHDKELDRLFDRVIELPPT